ncbi:MAG: toxin TcdB middle/N-terminal domain-containing protein [Myxococcota bacterium]
MIAALLVLSAPGTALATKSGVEPSRLKLPEGPGSIQGLGEDPEPNLTMGQAGYSVPMELPAGYAGLAPTLSLGYSSVNGAGVAGMGFSLGLDHIARMTRYGLPTYREGDRFSSSGAGELVEVDGSGTFRARDEGGFVRFRYVSGPSDHWVAEHPDGRRSYYGANELGQRDDNARIAVSGAGVDGAGQGAFRWCLVAQTDRLGHVVRYDHTLIDGYPYLTAIRWAFSDGPGVSGTPHYEAQLAYALRDDVIIDAKPGREVEMTQRLTSIAVYVDGSLLRRYALGYESYEQALGLSRLASVQTYGLEDDIPYGVSFSFGYSGPGSGELPYLVSMGSVGVDFRAGNAELLDINGDGLPDVVDSASTTQRFFINEPEADGEASLATAYASAVATDGGAPLSSPRVQPVDVDGDGFTDLVDGNNARTLRNSGTGDWAESVAGDFSLPDFENNPNLRFFDYDHDRRSDAILVTAAATFYYPNTPGSGFDATGITGEAIGVTLSEGLQFADMNGDGMQDAVQFLPGSGARYRPYLGFGRFGAWREMLGLETSGLTVSGTEVELVDVNLDGASDAVVVLADEVFCFLNQAGNAFSEVSLPTAPSNAAMPLRESDTSLRFADMNGNGSRDIVYISPSGAIDVLELFPTRAHLLARIENGIGKTNRMTYSTSAAEMARDGGPSAWTYRMPQPSVVLKELAVSDAHSNTTSRQRFVYRNGYYDGEDNQFNGFQDVEVHTPDDGTTEAGATTSVFDVGDTDRYFKGKLIASRVTSGGRDLTVTSTRFGDCPLERGLNTLTPAVRYICPLQIEVEHREGTESSQWVKTRKVQTYDAFGNVIREFDFGVMSRGGAGCGACEREAPQGAPCGAQCIGDELITDTEFATPTTTSDPWILRSPYRVQTRTVDDPNALSTELLTYYDGSEFEGLPLGKVEVGLPGRVQERETSDRFITRERNRYDVHGNLVETVDGRGFSTLFGYDARALLLTSETLTGFAGPDGDYALRMEVSHHPVLELVASASNWLRVQGDTVRSARATTAFGYSQYGELIARAAPGDTVEAPTTTYAYELGAPVSRIVERTRSDAGGTFDLESIQCFDGRGRAFQNLGRIEDGRYQAEGYTLYAPQGGESRAFQPHEQASGVCALAPPSSVAFTEMFNDATGRTVAVYEPDDSIYGSRSVTTTQYRPLETVAYDAIDNEPASPHFDTPSTTRVDGLGRTVALTRIVDATEPAVVLSVTYDALGRLQGLSDGAGYAKSQSYDLANRLLVERDPDRGVCTYAHDATDNVVRREDARGTVTEWQYDAASRPLSEQDSAQAESRIEYRYDVPVLCDVAYGDYGPGSRVEVDYPLASASGEASRAVDCAGLDARGRVARSERRLHGARFVFANTYDNADRLVATTLPTGRTIETAYDGLSRVNQVPGLIDAIAYRESGEPERIERSNGVIDTMAYDNRLRLTGFGVDGPAGALLARTLTRDRVSMVTEVVDGINRADGVASADARYTYDAAYRLVEAYLERARSAPPNASVAGSRETTAETLRYGYSGTDNILSKTSTLEAASRAHVGDYLYESDRPHAATTAGSIALDYDAAGNVIAIGTSAYTWDYRHKMHRAQTGPKDVANFAYDGDAVRVQKLEGPSSTLYVSPGFELRDGIATTWVTALGKKMVQLETTALAAHVLPDTFPLKPDSTDSEPDGRITVGDAWVVHARREGFLPNPGDSPSGPAPTVGEGGSASAGTFGSATASLYGTEGPSLETMLQAAAEAIALGEDDGDGEVQTHFHHDALGTTALTTDSDGQLLSETLHYPYGEWRYRRDDQLEVYSYTGVERDESTGLSANGARYLHLGLARFTSPDLLFADLATVLEESPWEHNLYAYGLGNPVVLSDPSGECAVSGDLTVNCAQPGIEGMQSGAASIAEGFSEIDVGKVMSGGLDVIFGAASATAGAALDMTVAGAWNTGVKIGTGIDRMVQSGGSDGAPLVLEGSGEALFMSVGGRAPRLNPRTLPPKPRLDVVTANGQRASQDGTRLGPSGKPSFHNSNSATRKRAVDGAKAQGSGRVVKDKATKKQAQHWHAVDGKGRRVAGSKKTHFNKRGDKPRQE